MKKHVMITALIIFSGMYCPDWAILRAQNENTKPLSGSSGIRGTASEKQIAEAELLWKLKRKRSALALIESLLEKYPADSALLLLAADAYLDQRNSKKALKMIRALERLTGKTETVQSFYAQYFIQEENWREAGILLNELRLKNPSNRETARSYAQVLAYQNRWKESREVYTDLLRLNLRDRDDILREKQEVIELGAPQVSTEFQYLHRPQSQRDYRFGQKGSFWMTPWLRLGTAVTEEYYRKKFDLPETAIRQFVASHALEGQLYYSNIASLLMRWKSHYFHRDAFDEMHLEADYRNRYFRAGYEYRYNEVAKDPVEALTMQGRIDRMRANVETTIFKRITGGHLFEVDWYRMPGKNNYLTGGDSLGYNLLNDAYGVLMIFEKPYLALNYHFRQAHWKQKFSGADTLIGYLTGEQAHYGGFNGAYSPRPWLDLRASVTRGSDRKRHVNYLYWVFECHLRINDHLKLTGIYEYDRGDSGTAGPGDTQIFSTKVDWFF